MKITLNIPDWDAAAIIGEDDKTLIIGDTSQLDITKGCAEVNIKLTKAYPKDQKTSDKPMSVGSESGASGSLSFV